MGAVTIEHKVVSAVWCLDLMPIFLKEVYTYRICLREMEIQRASIGL